ANAALANTFSQRVDFVPALSLLAESDRPDMNVQSAGQTTIGGVLYDVVALSFLPRSLPPGIDGLKATQRYILVDHATGLVARVRYTEYADDEPGSGLPVELVFSDYRPVNGLAIPYRREKWIEGRLASSVALDAVTFNTGLSDADFAS